MSYHGSLVLLNGGGVVVGHARLLPVAGTNAALIKSSRSTIKSILLVLSGAHKENEINRTLCAPSTILSIQYICAK